MSQAAAIRRFTRDHVTYRFDPQAKPVHEIHSGETVLVETLDAASGRLQRQEDLLPYLAWRGADRTNPATGPFRVVGAEPGDELAVHILEIRLADLGWTRLTKGIGTMKDEIEDHLLSFVRVEGNDLVFDFGVRLPARPMVGVIGTALADRSIPTIQPGPHGGNLDFNDVAVGTVAHLPVWVPGANFAIGDLHAVMGDGEVSGAAVEISGELTVRIDLLKGTGLRRPWFETPDHWLTYACAPKLEDAVRESVGHLATLLADRLAITRAQAYILITARGDVRIGQAADCGIDATVRALFPKTERREG
ncbi:MAG: acetamidase/formamidase family protein [Chloroflexi bacterium]|nr:acetamidase/formamidase family protein [Chloroflexota bacterium]